jgi:6-phosphogluconate dehydrogenase
MMLTRKFAVIGLGKMGGGLALQALNKGWEVIGYTLGSPSPELVSAGLKVAPNVGNLRELLPQRRVVLIYIPAGKSVDLLLDHLAGVLSEGDIVLDGGNSYWGDSIRRYHWMRERHLHFIDLGTSGGVSGARSGACFMAGGDDEPIAFVKELLSTLAVPEGLVHAGPTGAGHFSKLVHNGIEFGMLQAIGEGIDLLENWPKAQLEIPDILRCWMHGSVIRSWLIELMELAYRKNDGLDNIPGYIEDTGEVNWLVSDALHMEVPIPVISQAVIQLFTSRDRDKKWAKAVAMMRHEFGGHPFGPNRPTAEERHTGRVSSWEQDKI